MLDCIRKTQIFHIDQMISPEKSVNFECNYPILVEIYESIKNINDLSFKIRLRALNSLVSVSRDIGTVTGFRAISFELIRYSDLMESESSKLRELIHKILVAHTFQKKIDRTVRFIRRIEIHTNAEDQKFYKSDLDSIFLDNERKHLSLNENIYESIQLLMKFTKEFFKICMKGNSIAVLAKIESAYMKEQREVYMKLAEDVERFLAETMASLKNILTSLGIDISNEENKIYLH